MKVLKFLKLTEDAKIPTSVHIGDAAFDIYSNEEVVLKRGEIKGVGTGIASEIPLGNYVSFEGRSGLAIKNGIDVLGGIIDAGYRGEWKVILVNLGNSDLTLEKGERIAQGILHKLEEYKIEEVKELTETERGEAGFGSTGRK